MSIVDDPGVSVCFAVTIDNSSYDLGLFTTCDGLGCEVTVESRQEGGNNGFVHQLPGPMKYTNVKFTRPLNADSAKVASLDIEERPGHATLYGGHQGAHGRWDRGVQVGAAKRVPGQVDRSAVQR